MPGARSARGLAASGSEVSTATVRSLARGDSGRGAELAFGSIPDVEETDIGGLIAILPLVLINGFFVAAEFALVSSREERLPDTRAGRLARRQLQHMDEYLAACQVGITMASLALGALGEPALAGVFEPMFASLPAAHLAAVAATVAALLAMTALHITIGEQAPKSFAIGSAERVALACALPLELFHRSFRPLVLTIPGIEGRGRLDEVGQGDAGTLGLGSVEGADDPLADASGFRLSSASVSAIRLAEHANVPIIQSDKASSGRATGDRAAPSAEPPRELAGSAGRSCRGVARRGRPAA